MIDCKLQTAKLVLGFDFGTKYIGVAIGQTVTRNARPLTTIKLKNRHINWQTIDQLIKNWQPSILIVGIPCEMEGNTQYITLQTLKFFHALQTRYNLPIHKVDEHLSTWEAKKTLYLQKNNYSTNELIDINATAAAILIQQWFDSANL